MQCFKSEREEAPKMRDTVTDTNVLPCWLETIVLRSLQLDSYSHSFQKRMAAIPLHSPCTATVILWRSSLLWPSRFPSRDNYTTWSGKYYSDLNDFNMQQNRHQVVRISTPLPTLIYIDAELSLIIHLGRVICQCQGALVKQNKK